MSHVDIKHNPQPSGHDIKKNKQAKKQNKTKKKRNNSGLGVGKWSESEKMSGHAILKNLYEKKMDVILTISFKITAEMEIRKHMFCVLLRGVSAL